MTTQLSKIDRAAAPLATDHPPVGPRPGETREQFLKRVTAETDVEHRETLDRLAQ